MINISLDKFAYIKVSDISIQPNITIDGNDGPLLDDADEQLYGDFEVYEDL